MSEDIVTVYIRLLDEDVATARIAQAHVVGEQTYKIILPDDYDPDDGEWEFLPGDTVRCVLAKWDKEEPVNLAIEKIA